MYTHEDPSSNPQDLYKKLGVGCTCNPSFVWDGDRKIAGAYLPPAKLQAEQETLSQENNHGIMEQDTWRLPLASAYEQA